LAYRLIAIDLDDTLLTDGLEITPRNREAIRRAGERGVRITFATGRMFRSAVRFAEDLGLDIPLITYQGALIKDSRTGRVHYYQPLSLAYARLIIDRVKRCGYHVNAYLDDELYVEKTTAEAEGYASVAGVDIHQVGDLQRFLKTDPIKVLVISREELLDRLARDLAPVLGENVHVTKSKPNFLEFLHPRATKACGLAALAQNFGLGRKEVVAIGDSFNDLEMIRFAGLGVAMGNAREEVKAAADYVAPGNNEDGVADVIERFVLS
jgi:Cof subfamily protein (haloacid dehalogenase superfamily)